MSNPANALQAGIYTRLSNYAALTAVICTGKIYDFVPQSIEPPYVCIGNDTLSYNDTKSANAWEASIYIHCWSYENAGRKTTKTIMGHIYDALHNNASNVTVTGFSLLYLYCELQDTIQETAIDGDNDRYYHGIMRFKASIRT